MHRQTNKQQFKTIKTMTKEELAQKIAQGEYTDCQMDGKYSVDFRIGGAKASVTKIGNNFVAMTVISTCISDEDYNIMRKRALQNKLKSVQSKEKELLDEIYSL